MISPLLRPCTEGLGGKISGNNHPDKTSSNVGPPRILTSEAETGAQRVESPVLDPQICPRTPKQGEASSLSWAHCRPGL